MRTSENVDQLAPAFAKAQGDMKPAHKDSENPHYKSRYAGLASVWEACRAALMANGLFVAQDLENPGAAISVTTRVTHVSGQWMEFGPLSIPMAKPDAHGAGSAASYGRRYALAAALGIVSDEDDDGNGAARPEDKAPPRQARRPAAPPAPATAEPVPPPDYPVVSDVQADAIRSAAKAAGIKTLGPLKAALKKFADVEDVARVPADKFEHVMVQFDLMNAPEPPRDDAPDPFAEPGE